MTERERWLIIEGFVAGWSEATARLPPDARTIHAMAEQWLDSCIADAVTVEMALDKEASSMDIWDEFD